MRRGFRRHAARFLALAVVTTPSLATAADPAFDPFDDLATFDKAPVGTKPWRGDLAIGLQSNSGNTHSGSLTGRGGLDYQPEGRDNRLDFSYVDAWARDAATDRKLTAGDQFKIDVGQRNYAFAQARYAQDDAAAVTTRLSLATGFGRHLLTGTHKLDVDLGLGWSHSQDHDADDFEDQAIGVFGAVYRWTINANSEFRQTLQTEASNHDLFVATVTSLRLKLVASWFVSLDYELRHNRHAPADVEHTDQVQSLNLGWTFGQAPKTTIADPLLAQPPDDEYLHGKK